MANCTTTNDPRYTTTVYAAPIAAENGEAYSINTYNLGPLEGLPWHYHNMTHSVVCDAGSCLVRILGLPDVTLTPGMDPIIFPEGVSHDIQAIEAGTIIRTIYEYGP